MGSWVVFLINSSDVLVKLMMNFGMIRMYCIHPGAPVLGEYFWSAGMDGGMREVVEDIGLRGRLVKEFKDVGLRGVLFKEFNTI